MGNLRTIPGCFLEYTLSKGAHRMLEIPPGVFFVGDSLKANGKKTVECAHSFRFVSGVMVPRIMKTSNVPSGGLLFAHSPDCMRTVALELVYGVGCYLIEK